MAMFAPQFQLQAEQQRAGLLGQLGGEQMRRLGLLGGIGAQQQALQQAALEAPYQEFQRALGYAPQQFGLLATAVRGVPQQQTITEKTSPGIFDTISGGVKTYDLITDLLT
jgi:hypothetical protein